MAISLLADGKLQSRMKKKNEMESRPYLHYGKVSLIGIARVIVKKKY